MSEKKTLICTKKKHFFQILFFIITYNYIHIIHETTLQYLCVWGEGNNNEQQVIYKQYDFILKFSFFVDFIRRWACIFRNNFGKGIPTFRSCNRVPNIFCSKRTFLSSTFKFNFVKGGLMLNFQFRITSGRIYCLIRKLTIASKETNY